MVDLKHTGILALLRCMLCGLLIMTATYALKAQVVTIQLDTNLLALGDQTVLTVAATRDPMDGEGSFSWPTWTDTLTGGLEILKIVEEDTLAVELAQGRIGIQVTQKLLVTHWDSGFHTISPIQMGWNNDTIESNSLGIQVLMPEAGDAGKLAGHAPIRLTSWSWKERIQQFFPLALAAALVFAVGFWLFKKWKERGPKEETERNVPVDPLEAAHVIALRRLEAIQSDAVWKKGQIKLHHAASSEALRLYLEHRFHFPALERSTSEIKQAINRLPLSRNETDTLIEVLTLADLVKFAKFTPELSDHERIVSRSIEFVENTIPSLEAKETAAL
ncbi:MAG: hypothetical protein CL834_05190 [Crocinitomicaceae bacterium]|nr:hypothetical protein [Crocinitomicaceae bacterium]